MKIVFSFTYRGMLSFLRVLRPYRALSHRVAVQEPYMGGKTTPIVSCSVPRDTQVWRRPKQKYRKEPLVMKAVEAAFNTKDAMIEVNSK